jgi:hypothetical protein
MNEQNQAAASAKTQTATEPKTFSTIDGNSLMAQQYEPLQFSIDKILPHGIFVFTGSPKIGYV